MSDLMNRTIAAVALLNSQRYSVDTEQNRRIESFAFLSLFHPELTLTQRLRLAAEMAKR